MFRKVTIALAAGGALALGAWSVAASDSHGDMVRAAAQAAVTAEAHGDAVGLAASVKGQATRADARADAAAREAARDASATASKSSSGRNAGVSEDADAHGDLMSKTAKSDCTAAQETGKQRVNHGACVSEIASKNR